MNDNGTPRSTTPPPSAAQKPADGEQQLQQLVEKEPGNSAAWYQLGLLAIRMGRPAAAIPHLEKAVALDPRQPLLHHELGNSYQAVGQKDKAVHHFHQVVCLKPEYAEAHNNWGIALAQQGRFPEAIAAFTQALRLKPEYAEVHNNWGNAMFGQGQFREAAEHFRQALALHPQYAEAYNNLGLTQLRLGQKEQAAASFQKALSIRPRYLEAQLNLGNLCRDLGRLEAAVQCYRQVLQLRAEHREARQQLAVTLHQQGQLEEAIGCLYQGLLFHPDSPDTANLLGILLSQRDRLDEAAAAFRQAIRIKPDFAEAINNLGNTLLRLQQSDEAIQCFQQALQMRTDYAQPYCNLGSALLMQGKAEEALGHYQEALRIQPGYVDAHFNLGNAYRNLGRLPDAAACYRQVLQLQPDHSGAMLNLGVGVTEEGRLDEGAAILQQARQRHPGLPQICSALGVNALHRGQPDETLKHFEEGLQRKPDDVEIHLNRALTWLLLGDYEQGWVEYEWRWKMKNAMLCPYPQPAWDGTPLPQGTIVLWSEQGLGDSLQFVRYAALVKERVGTVLVDCPAPLRGLVASCPGVDGVVGSGAPGTAPDVQAALMSVPRILGTTGASIPAPSSYLFADGALRESWRTRLGTGQGLKVGLCWQGNPKHTGDRHRSITLTRFRALTEVPGVRLFSLQKATGSAQLAGLAEDLRITDLGGQISADFRDTAAAMANLDLVITVDTAVAHLAGSLGVPVWVLLPFNPDWRWLLGREESVWYPSARLFRQSCWGDWDEVFQRVAAALRQRALRPLRTSVPIQVSLDELLERAVLEEMRQGQAGENWAALRAAGLQDTGEAAELVRELRVAQQTLETLNQELDRWEPTSKHNKKAPNLVQRLVSARQQHRRALHQFRAWLAGEGKPNGTVATTAPATDSKK